MATLPTLRQVRTPWSGCLGQFAWRDDEMFDEPMIGVSAVQPYYRNDQGMWVHPSYHDRIDVSNRVTWYPLRRCKELFGVDSIGEFELLEFVASEEAAGV